MKQTQTIEVSIVLRDGAEVRRYSVANVAATAPWLIAGLWDDIQDSLCGQKVEPTISLVESLLDVWIEQFRHKYNDIEANGDPQRTEIATGIWNLASQASALISGAKRQCLKYDEALKVLMSPTTPAP